MLKQLIRPQEQIYYPDDVCLLVDIMNDAGYEVSYADAQWAWQQFSDDLCGSWLIVDGFGNDRIVSEILKYLEEFEFRD